MLKKEMDGLEYRNLKINPLEQTVYYFGEEIPLTNREFQLLVKLGIGFECGRAGGE